MYSCPCPLPTALTSVPTSDCEFNLRQLQRVFFQLPGFEFVTATSPIDTLASWTPLLTATDETKIIATPIFGGDPTITAGEATTEGGGDNSTMNGVEEITGSNPSTFSVMFKGLTPAQEKALKELVCRKKLVVYFANQSDQIVANASTGGHVGITIQSVFVGDRNNAGYGTKDTNMLTFQLPSGWSENLALITPEDFSPLNDL